MNSEFIYTLIASFTILFVGAVTIFHDKKSVTNKLFAFIGIATIFWSLANYFSLEPLFFSTLVWARLVLFFAVPHIVFFYLFIRNFPSPELRINKIEFFGLISAGMTVMLFALSPYVFRDVIVSGQDVLPVAGSLMPAFGIFVVFVLLASIVQIIIKYWRADRGEKKSWRAMLLGFLVSYFFLIWTNFILVNVYNDTRYIIYAPLFMLPLVGGTSFSILRYKLLNVKAIATEIIVFILLSVALVQLFLSQTTEQFIFNAVLFCAFLLVGIFLIKSVLREVEQREKLAKLNLDLEALIKQRESLVHLVTHKVKGSFTRSKYIFAGILDGTFGEAGEEIKKSAQQGLDSDNMGLQTVDLVLNVANMQRGAIKFDMRNVNFREIVEKILEEEKNSIEAKSLKLGAEIKEGNYNTLGDAIWLKEAAHNLIENAIKYTKKGEITVSLEKKVGLPAQAGKILLSVRDTGVGIAPEDKAHLFTEGGRGKDSVKINVDSTGYGLYSVKLIMDAHGGRVWGESAGVGQGSAFFLELNAI